MWWITHLTIEGFRGVNKPIEMDFDPKTSIILLEGRNGLGKTCTLQAIEWCLTGNLMFFSGGDFTREDAFVNLFHPTKKGYVKINLQGDKGRQIEINRSKKLGRSTGRGGSSLQVVIDGERLAGEEAELAIAASVFESVDEPASLFHLHQDSLRQILTADPKERSRAIDKILGTFETRDFLDSLDIKRKLTQTFRKIEAERSSLERDRVQVAIAAREKLNKQKSELEAQGWKNKLESQAVRAELESTAKRLQTVADGIGYAIPSDRLIVEKNDSSEKMISRFRSEIQRLDRSRISSASTIREKRTTISSALEQYQSAEKAVETLGAEKVGDPDKKKLVAENLQKLDAELTGLERIISGLEQPTENARTLHMRIQELRAQLEPLQKLIGEEDAQKVRMEKLKESVRELEQDLTRFSAQKQLVAAAIEYLESAKPDVCPVCFQKINANDALDKLRAESADQQVRKLVADLSKERDQLRRLEGDMAAFKRLSIEQSELGQDMQKLMAQIRTVIHQELKSAEELTSAVSAIDQKAVSLRRQRGELEGKLQAINEREKVVEQSRIMQGQAVSKLQQILGSEARGKELLVLATREEAKLGGSEMKLNESNDIDQINDKLHSLERVVAYLGELEELKKLEQEIPRIEKVAKDLEKRLDKLASLDGSITSITGVLSAHLEGSVADLLGSLETTINHYYSSMSGHPYFVKIKLEPDAKKPLMYNVRASTQDETISTYISTRFSSAQMNCAGIALFLAHAKKVMNQLATIMMDDPTQSLDEPHKQGLASVIKELTETRQVFVATQDEDFANMLQRACSGEVALWRFEAWGEQGPVMEET